MQHDPMDILGYKIFDALTTQVVLFKGTHRFLANDPLVELLQHMRRPGGGKLPSSLRDQLLSRIMLGSADPRMQPTYCVHENGKQIGNIGFFSSGFYSAINWEQVSRMQIIWSLQNAAVTIGPYAYRNLKTGKPQRVFYTFPPAACRAALAIAKCFPHTAYSPGQLLFIAQRVDRMKLPDLQNHRLLHVAALEITNMTKTGNFMPLCPLFLGLRVKITKKLLPPEVVQEASGEIVDIAFHDDERFGEPIKKQPINAFPHSAHPCWQVGYVLLDYLPRYVAVRLDDCTEDYTNSGRPGVYIVEPSTDDWYMEHTQTVTVDHKLAPRQFHKSGKVSLPVRSWQLPLAPQAVCTYNNMQGKTARNANREPAGHIVDLRKQLNMGADEYWQHVYMILGRAISLNYTLLINFPREDDETWDLSVFEQGPPASMLTFFNELEKRAAETLAAVETARKLLKVFPSWQDRPQLQRDPLTTKFAYDSRAWDAAASLERRTSGVRSSPSKRQYQHDGSLGHRVLDKLLQPSLKRRRLNVPTPAWATCYELPN